MYNSVHILAHYYIYAHPACRRQVDVWEEALYVELRIEHDSAQVIYLYNILVSV